MDLKFYFSLFLRRAHWFLLFLVIGTAAGLTVAQVLPPVYEARARLLVESEQIPDELAQTTVQTETNEQLQIIQQRILTRSVLLDMADRLGVYDDDPRRVEGSLTADAIVADLRERISIDVSGGVQRRGPVQATIVNLRFRAPEAPLAATVTNELVTMVLREDVGMRTRVARQTLEFFEQEVARLDRELSARGAAILEFQEANQSSLPDSLDFRRAQQAANQERLVQLDREEAGLRDRRARVEDLRGVAGANADPARDQTPEERQLAALRSELAQRSAVLSPQNPRIRLLQGRIDALEETVAAQRATALDAQPRADGTVPDLVDLQIAEIDGQLQFIADQKSQIQGVLADLARTIEETPGNTITLDTLRRDYDNVRAQYDQAVANRATAETGDVIESLSRGRRISVVEQATTPPGPKSPNRPLIAAAGILGGAALGLAVVLLLSLLDRSLRRPADLAARLDITPIATLPYYRTSGEIWRRRGTVAAVLGVALIGVPVVLWGVHTFYMPIDQLLGTVGRRIGLAGILPTLPPAA